MPQSEGNPPAHLHEIKIKENLNYTVLNMMIGVKLPLRQLYLVIDLGKRNDPVKKKPQNFEA